MSLTLGRLSDWLTDSLPAHNHRRQATRFEENTRLPHEMASPEPEDTTWLRSVFGKLRELQKENQCCDVLLETNGAAENVPIPVHSCVLAASSSLFREYLIRQKSGFTRVRTHLSLAVLSSVVRFLYTGILDMDTCDHSLLLTACEHLGITLPVDTRSQLLRLIALKSEKTTVLVESNDDDNSAEVQEKFIAKEIDRDLLVMEQPETNFLPNVNTPDGYQAASNKAFLEQVIDIDRRGKYTVAKKNFILLPDGRPCDVLKTDSQPFKLESSTCPEDDSPGILQSSAALVDEDAVSKQEGVGEKTEIIDYKPKEESDMDLEKINKKPLRRSCRQKKSVVDRTQLRTRKQKRLMLQLSEKDSNLALTGTSTRDMKYACEQCGKQFPTSDLRRLHRRNHRKKTHKCSFCEKRFTIPYLKKIHERSHTGSKPFACLECNNSFTTGGLLNQHVRCHHASEQASEKPTSSIETEQDSESFPCEQCDKVFDTKLKRKYHRRTHRQKVYKCSSCEKAYATPYLLKVHERQHTGERPYQCDMCDSSFVTPAGLNSHKLLHTGVTPFVCSFCSQPFTHKSSLVRHEANHTGVKPYQCSHCGKGFVFNSYRLAHEKSHSSIRMKPHKCSICSKPFAEKAELRVHIRRHTGETPYQCQFCPKMFASRRVLRNHEKTHRSEKPLKCPLCDKRFHTSSQVKSHKRTHTGERPFQCSVCGKCFSQNCGLNHHMRTHTGERPFACKYCEKRFTTKNKMEDHERVHTGDKPYSCKSCDKSFTQLSILKVHERIHTGERPYKCSFCDWRSITKQHLTRHEKTHLKRPSVRDDGGGEMTSLSMTTYDGAKVITPINEEGPSGMYVNYMDPYMHPINP